MVVLILIVVEDDLVLYYCNCNVFLFTSLNPCCSGRWSRTVDVELTERAAGEVLILVVVEDGLVLTQKIMKGTNNEVLILVVVEDGLVPRTLDMINEAVRAVLILVVVEDGLVLPTY